MSTVRRSTKETDVTVEVGAGGAEPSQVVETTDAFLDHMLATMARYAGLDLVIRASGDLDHHLREDVALTLGRALAELRPATCARKSG